MYTIQVYLLSILSMKVANKQEQEKGFEFQNAESRYQMCTST